MSVNTHDFIKFAKKLNMEAWLYFFIYREFRQISKKHGVSIKTNNYGFYPTKIDAHDKYQLQLYDEYVTLLAGENIEQVLEIGCGAGGGLMYMQSCLPQTNFTGLDRCKEALKTCKYFFDEQQSDIKLYNSINEIHKDNKKFDAVMSVETGIYKNPSIFSDIHKLLDDDGVFIYYDNANFEKLDGIFKSIEASGFEIALIRDITENVFQACEYDTPRRLEIIKKYLPKSLKPFNNEILRYMCVKDSSRYNNYSIGKKRAFMLKARKIGNNLDNRI
ncbi:Methyltransferase domain-containing protein [Nitrosomonas cryotolerans]|uniref:Methyltransferase domain-containing protein n=2 Tax=Nitrosomonas cryotolerans TaxID=44575 RepID=A0A1N6FVY9_9PROT|nr:class I SAM-dependent methyltransferase [Nitrosomonas cryotolerans]SFP76121.1 Methyltransferase domain-containing protein [Nitrosomonas cryotolerans]SIN99465.1 Methyltransferase domain-containing protein [Nitrosomonas cryotolerans ATCC 49181]